MTSRLCLRFDLLLALALGFAASNAWARDARMSSPGSGSCPDAAAATDTDTSKPAPRATRATPPARETKVRPVLHGDAPRTVPRWHSFLPGMFR